MNHRNVNCIYVCRHVISRSKKNKSPKYGRDILCHPVSGALEYFLKSNHSLYYLYTIKYILVYSIWWSEALLWRPPFFFFSQPAAGLTNQVLVQDSQAGTPLACHKSPGYQWRIRHQAQLSRLVPATVENIHESTFNWINVILTYIDIA